MFCFCLSFFLGGSFLFFISLYSFFDKFLKYLCESFSFFLQSFHVLFLLGFKNIFFIPPTILVFTVAEKGNPDLHQRAPLQQTFHPATPPPRLYLVLHLPLPLHLLLGRPLSWLRPLPRPQHLGPLLPHPLPPQDPQVLVPPLVPPSVAAEGVHC